MDLDGILNADLTASFAMDDIDKERYENVNSSGSASLSNFNYASEEMANPVKISKAVLKFNPGSVDLQEFSMKTGETDAQLNGTLQNLMGYLFKDQPIKGNFNLKSTTFSVNDFMVAEESSDNEEKEKKKSTAESSKQVEEAIKIPSFLDVNLNFTADKILYDNLTLTNGKGALSIKDEKATLQNISADIFGGNIGLNGSVSTKTETPKFDVQLSLNKIGIAESLQEMELLKSLAPIAQAFVGDLTTKIDLNGDLTKDLSPIYSSLSGSGLAEILNATVQKNELSFVSQLDEKLDFINLNDVKLKDLTTQFSFSDGGVDFKPFNFNLHKDIKAEIKGRHTFDNELDYKMDLDIPVKYLGKEISKQLAKLTEDEVENMKVDLPIKFSGGIKKPKISVDMKAATKELTDEIIAKQKGKLEDKAKDKAKDLLDGFLKDDKEEQEKDSLTTEEKDKKEKKEEEKSNKDKAKDKAKDALKDIFGKKNK